MNTTPTRTVKDGEEPIHFGSLELMKKELLRLGSIAAPRLHNAYDECGSDEVASYCDIELSLITLNFGELPYSVGR